MRMPLIFVPLLLAGCSATPPVDAPSLLPRAIETRSDAEPSAAPQTATPDPSLDAKIAERVSAFDAAARKFDSARPAIAAAVARGKGAAAGSDRWLDAQTAIGTLQQLRTTTIGAMAELEALAIERASGGAVPYPALNAAITTAQAELDRQAAAEAAVKAQLGS